jgi:hypothetical protein
MTAAEPPEVLRFVDGPNVYSYVATMFLTIVVVVMVMFSMSPTANPSLQLQGGEALARVEERLSLVSAILAGMAALLILPLMKWRITVVDFARREFRVETRALPPGRRVVRFDDVRDVTARRREHHSDYVLHDVLVTPIRGGRISVGASAMDWGVDACAGMIRAQIDGRPASRES